MFRRIADWLFEKYEADYYRRAFNSAEPVEVTVRRKHPEPTEEEWAAYADLYTPTLTTSTSGATTVTYRFTGW